DVLARHVRVARGVEGATEPRVTVGVAAAEPRRDRDLLDDLREDLAALRVLGALPVLDRGPFVVAAHRFSCGALDTSEGAPSLPTGVLGDVDDPPFVALPLEDDDEACGETDGRAVAVDPDVEVERIGRAIDERVDLAQEGAPPLGGEDAEHPG